MTHTLTQLRARLQDHPAERVIFALDVPELAQAEQLVELLRGELSVFKVGLELFTGHGPAALTAVHDRGGRVFLDLKLHDIPATVERAVASAVQLGAAFLTVHAASGPEALRSAARAAQGSSLQLLAVTVLTSADDALLAAIGLQGPLPAAVSRLARLALDAGVSGLVCAPSDCAALRAEFGERALLVTPGVRPEGDAAQDQKRVASPRAAVTAGADLLVVGRPIRDARDPRAAAHNIVREIS